MWPNKSRSAHEVSFWQDFGFTSWWKSLEWFCLEVWMSDGFRIIPIICPRCVRQKTESKRCSLIIFATLLTLLSRELCSTKSCSVNSHPSSPLYIYLRAAITPESGLCSLVSRCFRKRFVSWKWLWRGGSGRTSQRHKKTLSVVCKPLRLAQLLGNVFFFLLLHNISFPEGSYHSSVHLLFMQRSYAFEVEESIINAL